MMKSSCGMFSPWKVFVCTAAAGLSLLALFPPMHTRTMEWDLVGSSILTIQDVLTHRGVWKPREVPPHPQAPGVERVRGRTVHYDVHWLALALEAGGVFALASLASFATLTVTRRFAGDSAWGCKDDE